MHMSSLVACRRRFDRIVLYILKLDHIEMYLNTRSTQECILKLSHFFESRISMTNPCTTIVTQAKERPASAVASLQRATDASSSDRHFLFVG